MQITISTITVGKSGDSEKNGKPFHWTMHNFTFPELTIFEQNGTQHKFTKASTFEDIASTLKPNDTIECEIELNQNKGNTYANFKGIKKVVATTETDKGSPELPRVGKDPPDDKAYWEKKQAIERESIERQVSAKIAFEFGINEDKEAEGNTWSTAKALNQAEQIYQWIHSGTMTNAPQPSETPKPAEKPTEAKVEGKLPHETMDKQSLLNSVKYRMKYKDDATAISWLVNVNHIPAERIDKEPAVVYKEMQEKYKWS